jgi:hypothetical protein
MRRTRLRKAKQARGARSLLGVALIGAVLLALSGLALAGFLLRPPQTDEATLCRLDQPPAAHTLILIDATDKLEPRHRRRLRTIAAQERERLTQGDRFTLMRLDARRPHEPRILFSKCLPKPPELTNPLFENPRLAQEHWDAAFEDALQGALRSAQAASRQSASPIIAGLRAAAADPDFIGPSARRLVLVSDLLEYDPNGFSLYAADATFETWASADVQGPPDLDGVTVRVARLDRPDNAEAQANALIFWDRFLDATGARDIAFDATP